MGQKEEKGPIMAPKNIVIGQMINPQKSAIAHELRRSMTDAEKLLWQHLRANRLNGWHFRRQQVIAGYIVDFYCHAASLVLEVDGSIHKNQIDHDLERDQVLQGLMLRVLRIKNQEVFDNLEAVLQKIRDACSAEPSLQHST
jgi:very-short-patch-repair endonuclease